MTHGYRSSGESVNDIAVVSTSLAATDQAPGDYLGYGLPMTYEYTEIYIPVGKTGWKELGSALVELPAQGWELFMAVPIIGLTAFIPGISGSRTTAIVHYFRREKS